MVLFAAVHMSLRGGKADSRNSSRGQIYELSLRTFCASGQEIAYRRFPNLIEQAELRTDILLVA